MKFKVIVEYEYPIEHKPPVKAEIVLHGDKVITDNIKWVKQEPKIDILRAEIEQKIIKRPYMDFKEHERWHNDAILEVLDIIDKYKGKE